jgi:hypothetical protein
VDGRWKLWLRCCGKSVSDRRRIFVLETESMEKVRLPRRPSQTEEDAPLIVERICLRSVRYQNGKDDEAITKQSQLA